MWVLLPGRDRALHRLLKLPLHLKLPLALPNLKRAVTVRKNVRPIFTPNGFQGVI